MNQETSALSEAFEAQVMRDKFCAYWNGPKDEDGAPIIHHEGQAIPAAHVAFFLDRGSWPRGRALHLCGDEDCICPWHVWFKGLAV